MKRQFYGLVVLIIFITMVLSGCVSNTRATINTNIDGVEVKVDGERLGSTPVQITASNALWDDPEITLAKHGYKPVRTAFKKELKVPNLIFGLILWWPSLLYVWGPDSDQYFEMIPE